MSDPRDRTHVVLPVLQPAQSAEPFHVVFVCTGNRARSPLAEVLLRSKCAPGAVLVESYGTLELGPEPAMPEAIVVAASLGVDLSDHRARSLAGVRLDEADLVIGFEPFHRAATIVDAHAKRERVFMLRELVALLDGFVPSEIDPESRRPRAAVAHAHAQRAGARPSALSLADPNGKSKRFYRKTGEAVDSLTSSLVASLFGMPAEAAPDSRG